MRSVYYTFCFNLTQNSNINLRRDWFFLQFLECLLSYKGRRNVNSFLGVTLRFNINIK